MPYKSATTRRKMHAESMRRKRIYDAAVVAGTPEAVEAERWRNPEAALDLICAETPRFLQHRLRYGKPTHGMVRDARVRFYTLRKRAIDAYLKAQIFS